MGHGYGKASPKTNAWSLAVGGSQSDATRIDAFHVAIELSLSRR
jgi:hypothetical protein